MKTPINPAVFFQADNIRAKNSASAMPILEASGFAPRHGSDSVMERRFLDYHQVVILSDGKIILHTALSSKVKSDAIGDASQVVLAFNRRHLDIFGISAGIDARDGEVCLDHGIWTHSEPISTTAFSDILDKYLESVDDVMEELLDAISPFLPRLLDDDSSHENPFRRLMPRFPTDDGDDDEDDDDGDDSSIDWSALFSHLSDGSDNDS